MSALGDLLARADKICCELHDRPDSVPLNAWVSFDATAYLLMRELVGPARIGNRAFTLSQASLCRMIDAYPAPLRSATTGPVDTREVAHLLGRPRSVIMASIRKGEIPATWDGRQYLVDAADLPNGREVRPADPLNPEPLSRLSCTLGAAADLVAQNRSRLTRDTDAAVESPDCAVTRVLVHVMGIVHVAASHAVRVGPPGDVDRPLAVARYSAVALDALGDLRRGSAMMATASFAPASNPVSLNERLDSGLRAWVTAARVELNRMVPSTDVIRNVMNQGIHLYAVSARLLEATECTGELAKKAVQGSREHLHTAMTQLGEAERLWGSVTTAIPPSQQYVSAARELHGVLTEATPNGPHPRDSNEITKDLNIGQALTDLRYAASDFADLARDIQDLPDPLLRSGLLLAPGSKLSLGVGRLRDSGTGGSASVLPDEPPDLASAARSAATRADLAVQALDVLLWV